MKKNKNIICFVHIERCGGTSLHHMLRENLPFSYFNISPRSGKLNKYGFEVTSEQFSRLIHTLPFIKGLGGHNFRAYNNYEATTKKKINYITFLRDPVKRYLSHFNFQKARLGIDWTIEEFIEHERFNNFQTTKIAGESNLDKAIEIINHKFSFVGITEQYYDSLRLLSQMFDLKFNYQIVNQTEKNFLKFEDLNDMVKQRIHEKNDLDLQLYDYVKNQIFSKYLNNLENDSKDVFKGSFNKTKVRSNFYFRGFFRYFIEPYIMRE